MTHTPEEIEQAVGVLVETVYELPDKFFFLREDDLSKGFANRRKMSRAIFKLGNRLKLFVTAKDIDLSKLMSGKEENNEMLQELQKLLTVNLEDSEDGAKDETDDFVGELKSILTQAIA